MLDPVWETTSSFAQQLGLAALVIIAFTQLPQLTRRLSDYGRNVILGIICGAATIMSMNTGVNVAPGVNLDARSTLLALASAFGGLPAAVTSAAMAGGFRLWLGGSGAVPGLVGIVATSGAALLYSLYLQRRHRAFNAARLSVLGLVVAIVAYIPLALIPDPGLVDSLAINGTVLRPFTILGTVVFGLLLVQERRRRELERDLADSVSRFTLLADNARDAITVITATGEQRFASPALSRLLGYPVDLLLGRSCLELVHPDDQTRLAAVMAAPDFGANPTVMQYRVRRADGRYIWVESSVSRLGASDPAFGQEFIWVMRDVTERKAIELALDSARAELDKLSRCDPLTDVANRRHLDEMFPGEWRRCLRNGTSLAVLMLDIDHFKAFNDSQGHTAGDECIRRVAQAIQAKVQRPGDLTARYGGEEFIVILPNTDLKGACHIGEEIAAAVRDLDLRNDCGSESGVTVSIGVSASVPTPDGHCTSLVEAADRALYTAKKNGRDRVEMAKTEPAARSLHAPAAP